MPCKLKFKPGSEFDRLRARVQNRVAVEKHIRTAGIDRQESKTSYVVEEFDYSEFSHLLPHHAGSAAQLKTVTQSDAVGCRKFPKWCIDCTFSLPLNVI